MKLHLRALGLGLSYVVAVLGSAGLILFGFHIAPITSAVALLLGFAYFVGWTMLDTTAKNGKQ